MKTIAILLISLISLNQEKLDQKKEVSAEEEIAAKIVDAFRSYKDKDIESCKTIMEDLSFVLTKEMKRPISGKSTIDSLIFENSEILRWAYYKTVDLDYLRNVEVMVALKHAKSDEIATILTKKLINQKTDVVTENTLFGQKKIEIIEAVGADVIDDRFVAKPVSNISSLYQYQIVSDGEYVFAILKETVPKRTLQNPKPIKTIHLMAKEIE
ncbi:hypothetical protein [Ekhidna sp.]